MSKKLNKNIAEALDMRLPEESDTDQAQNLVSVEPHDLAKVDNPDLPDMTDTDMSIAEGEKQLEELITKGMTMINSLYEELPEIEPKFRNRHMEITSILYQGTLSAISTKLDTQMKKKKQRLEEANFKKNGTSKEGPGGPKTVNNFFGSREDLMRMVDESQADSDENNK